MSRCPECDRPILSVHFKKCLYCGASLSDDLLAQIEPPNLKQVDAMMLIHRQQELRTHSSSYLAARIVYGALSLIGLGGALWLVLYALHHGPGGTTLAIFVSLILLGFVTFTTYKTFRPEPMQKLRKTSRRRLD